MNVLVRILLGVVALVIIIGAGAGAWVFFTGDKEPAAKQQQAPITTKAPAATATPVVDEGREAQQVGLTFKLQDKNKDYRVGVTSVDYAQLTTNAASFSIRAFAQDTIHGKKFWPNVKRWRVLGQGGKAYKCTHKFTGSAVSLQVLISCQNIPTSELRNGNVNLVIATPEQNSLVGIQPNSFRLASAGVKQGL